ncbi:MAG: hypothetical protein R3B72_40310 [Polyangiaceae bacterium]
MLISVRHLVDRRRHPRERADALARLRARFAAQASASKDPERISLARELRALRRSLHDALAALQGLPCSGCAFGHPLPEGRYAGGHCCGSDTLRIFTEPEVLALRLGGTRPRKLRPADGPHAGCAFRGATGCTLEPEDRPSICLRYVCPELHLELRGSPEGRRVLALAGALRDGQARFEALGADHADGSVGSLTFRSRQI